MSRFKTVLSVDVAGVRQALPPGSYVESVTFDEKEGVAVVWDHPALTSKFTFPVEFPLADLTAARVPAGVVGNVPSMGAEEQKGKGAGETAVEGVRTQDLPPLVTPEPEPVKTEGVDKKGKGKR